ncbi:MAG: aminoacyl--tRNA ligase-related protein [Promethearchaeota archaeon]
MIEYKLTGRYICSKDITEKKDDVLESLKKVENELLEKTKTYHDINYKSDVKILGEKTINISIQTCKISSHEIFYRIKKNLAAVLGKNLKIGIRDLFIDSLEITFDIERPPRKDIKVPFVSSLVMNEDKCSIKFSNIDRNFIMRNYIERTINLIKEKIDRTYYEGKAEYHELVYTSPKRETTFNKDPTVEMLNLNWIAPASTKGKWIFYPPAVALKRAMEKIVVEVLLQPLGFKEMMSSNIVSGEDIWLKTGHLEGMPMEIYYVAEPVSRNPEIWEHFIDVVKITKEIPYDEFKTLVELKPLKGLVYAQCPSLYHSFKGKTIASKDFPILIYDRTVNSFRYESGGRHGIERVDEFHRIEVVYIGTPDQIEDIVNKIREIYKKIFNEILELEWRMARVTPFYIQQEGSLFKEESKKSLLGTIDFEAWLPYRGSREESEWLEFQNLSIVGNKYVDAFNIKAQKGEKLWSGCTGIGLERWIVAFLAQKGFDVYNWPEKFKKYIGEIPETFKFF